VISSGPMTWSGPRQQVKCL